MEWIFVVIIWILLGFVLSTKNLKIKTVLVALQTILLIAQISYGLLK